MSESYIRANFDNIVKHASVIEKRLCDTINIQDLIKDNNAWLTASSEYGLNVCLIDNEYNVDFEI